MKFAYCATKSRPWLGAYKLSTAFWMGCSIVQIELVQMKGCAKGSKDPSAPQKRRRGRRGRRTGRARVRHTREPAKPPTIPQNQTSRGNRYTGKARARRDQYMTSRFKLLQSLFRKCQRLESKGKMSESDTSFYAQAWIHRSQRFILSMQAKRPPLDVMLKINDFLVPLIYAIPKRDPVLSILSDAAQVANERRKKTRGSRGVRTRTNTEGLYLTEAPVRRVHDDCPRSKDGRHSDSQICRFCGGRNNSDGRTIRPKAKRGGTRPPFR